jgi:cytochrome c-type biogenesis protein CcmH
MIRTAGFLLLTMLLLAAGPIHAVQPDEILADAALEGRARAISQDLRCLVCQNQSIDDSNAPLARDLRVLVRERLSAGDSDRQVVDFIVARYGEFVLLKPRLNWRTAILWATPPTILLVSLVMILLLLRGGAGRAMPAGAMELTDTERVKLRAIEQSSDGVV